MLRSLSCCRPFLTARDPQPREAMVAQSEIGPLYDKLSGHYDIWAKLTESRAEKRALELARIHDGARILEVAVGTGQVFQEIVRRNPNGENTGIDLSEGMLARARHRLSNHNFVNYRLIHGSAMTLQIQSSSIDLLMNNYMVDLIPYAQIPDVLAEFHRVLKPGGRLVLVNMTKGQSAVSNLYDRIFNCLPRLSGGCRGLQMSAILQQHRFRVQTREYIQQCLFPSEVIVAGKGN